MKFLDVKTDFAFKKVFGSKNSKDILMSFLNATIYGGENRIRDLMIMDPYQIPKVEGMKDTYVDVKAELDSGASVIIEMQVLNVQGFEQRILLNAAKSYCSQLARGDQFHDLTQIIALTLTDFVMFPESESVRSCFRMKEINRHTEYKNHIELVFFELPKFKKNEAELTTLEDKWLFFVKMSGKLYLRPTTLDEVREIGSALDIANEANLTEAEAEAQWKRRDFIMLQKGALDKATQDGMAQGMAQGMAEGIDEGMSKILRGMHEGGMSISQIASLAKLPEARVNALLGKA
jgi:predicted transposase/invertase (TIGR01784 family)